MSLKLLCPACLSDGAIPWVEKGGHTIFRCGDCRTGFLDRDNLTIDFKTLYGPAYYSGDGRRTYLDYAAERDSLRLTYQRVLRWMAEHQLPGSLIDVGCAMGFFMEAAREQGWEPLGFDVSAHATEIASRTCGPRVVCADFTSSGVHVQIEGFDAIVALDTIEHLLFPEHFLEKARAALRPEGICLVSTGDFSSLFAVLSGRRWRLLQPPEHVFFFTRHGLLSLLRRNGFEVLGFRTFRKLYSASSLARFVGLRLSGPLGRLRVPVNLFDVMYVMSRKT